MLNTIFNSIISYVVPIILGFLIGIIKNAKNREKTVINDLNMLKENQLLDMRSDLSNKFYVYDAMEEVEDYLIMSFQEKCERYFEMGGDNWIHPMYDKSKTWKIKPTGYLK